MLSTGLHSFKVGDMMVNQTCRNTNKSEKMDFNQYFLRDKSDCPNIYTAYKRRNNFCFIKGTFKFLMNDRDITVLPIQSQFTLSLYSTRTQNTWRRGLALGSAPDARILRYPTQNIPTCWYLLRFVTPIPCVGHVHFIFLCRFYSRWLTNANPISSGI